MLSGILHVQDWVSHRPYHPLPTTWQTTVHKAVTFGGERRLHKVQSFRCFVLREPEWPFTVKTLHHFTMTHSAVISRHKTVDDSLYCSLNKHMLKEPVKEKLRDSSQQAKYSKPYSLIKSELENIYAKYRTMLYQCSRFTSNGWFINEWGRYYRRQVFLTFTWLAV